MYVYISLYVSDIKALSCQVIPQQSHAWSGIAEIYVPHLTLFGMSTVNRIMECINNPLCDTHVYLWDLFLG